MYFLVGFLQNIIGQDSSKYTNFLYIQSMEAEISSRYCSMKILGDGLETAQREASVSYTVTRRLRSIIPSAVTYAWIIRLGSHT
jgi:hypothetical protein